MMITLSLYIVIIIILKSIYLIFKIIMIDCNGVNQLH
jgi:hypothetical protein